MRSVILQDGKIEPHKIAFRMTGGKVQGANERRITFDHVDLVDKKTNITTFSVATKKK